MNLTDIGNVLVASYGDIKTAKTSFGLSMPKPMVNFDFDQSFRRAAFRYVKAHKSSVRMVDPHERLTAGMLDSPADITTLQYKMPIKFPGKQREGFLDLWEGQVLPDLFAVYESSNIKSVMIDTGTIMWELCHQAHLERMQRLAPADKPRIQLTQIEYGRPNSECKAVYAGARVNGKHLITLNHLGPKFGVGIVEEKKGARTERSMKSDVVIGETWQGLW